MVSTRLLQSGVFALLCFSLSFAFCLPSGAQNAPGTTDNVLNAAALPTFKYEMGKAPLRTFEGGSAQEATVKDFPISTGIAGVSMFLKPGGLRELHWHANAAEWSYVIKGHCRVTVVDPEGRSEVLDFGPGDVWYFPRGHGHSIQGIGDEECHFILVFDNGAFSEFATFSITDWISRTPKEVLAKQFKVPVDTFNNFPKKEVYIAQGPVPAPLPAEAAPYTLKSPPFTHKYQLAAQRGTIFDGGTFRVASQKEFPISTTMTGAVQILKPNAMREMHWHPNANEWQYYIRGKARVTLFGSNGRSRTEEFGPGDVGYVPQGYGHYIENASQTEDCETLIVLDNGNYQEISLSTWMNSNPSQLLQTNFGVSKSILDSLNRKDTFITVPSNSR